MKRCETFTILSLSKIAERGWWERVWLDRFSEKLLQMLVTERALLEEKELSLKSFQVLHFENINIGNDVYPSDCLLAQQCWANFLEKIIFKH